MCPPQPIREVRTDAAPAPVGPYSQAVVHGGLLYASGQIPLDPASMEVVEGGIAAEITRVFDNLKAVAEASGGNLADIVKLNIFLVDLGNFPIVNEIMAQYFAEPYPARAAIGVKALPKGVGVEMDAVLVID